MEYVPCDACGGLVRCAEPLRPGEALVCQDCLSTRRVVAERGEAGSDSRKHVHKFRCPHCERKLRRKPVAQPMVLCCPSCGGTLHVDPDGSASAGALQSPGATPGVSVGTEIPGPMDAEDSGPPILIQPHKTRTRMPVFRDSGGDPIAHNGGGSQGARVRPLGVGSVSVERGAISAGGVVPASLVNASASSDNGGWSQAATCTVEAPATTERDAGACDGMSLLAADLPEQSEWYAGAFPTRSEEPNFAEAAPKRAEVSEPQVPAIAGVLAGESAALQDAEAAVTWLGPDSQVYCATDAQSDPLRISVPEDSNALISSSNSASSISLIEPVYEGIVSGSASGLYSQPTLRIASGRRTLQSSRSKTASSLRAVRRSKSPARRALPYVGVAVLLMALGVVVYCIAFPSSLRSALAGFGVAVEP